MLSAGGIATGSLTLVSEAVRGVFMLGASAYSFWVMWAIVRGRLAHYQFGVGKLEQFVTTLVGIGLLVSAGLIGQSVLEALTSEGPPASPRGLAIAAVLNAVNTLINTMAWFAMMAQRRGGSAVYKAQLAARTTMMVSSLTLQVTLTVAALAQDAEVALLMDTAGATFVVVIMCLNGFAMVARALPDLLDAPAHRTAEALVKAAVGNAFADGDVAAIKTRRVASATYAEILLSHQALNVHGRFVEAVGTLQAQLAEDDADVRISFAVNPPDAGKGHTSAVTAAVAP
ncbi:MAG: cation transporter [Devosia sp.]